MREHKLLFVPERVPEYTYAAPPEMLPVSLNGRDICRAIYNDGRYSFYLPERLDSLCEKGLVTMRIVFSHPSSGESYAPKANAQLVRIQIEAEPDILGISGQTQFPPRVEEILEL